MKRITLQAAAEFLTEMPVIPEGRPLMGNKPLGGGSNLDGFSALGKGLLSISPMHARIIKMKPAFLKEISLEKDAEKAGKILGVEIIGTEGEAGFDGGKNCLAVGGGGALAIAVFARYYSEGLGENAPLIRMALGAEMPKGTQASPEDAAFALLFMQLASGGIKDAFERLDITPHTVLQMEKFGWGRQPINETAQSLLDIQIDFCKKVWLGSKADK